KSNISFNKKIIDSGPMVEEYWHIILWHIILKKDSEERDKNS
ncbi:hypothetical protein Golax_025430, partial [Gossypium laxum]|nr:hypothetical protein [Gossypium laxum]